MKNLNGSIPGSFLYKRIQSVRSHWKKYLFRIALILFLMGLFNIIPGCLYYKVVSKSNPQSQDISENLIGGKVFVVHSDTNSFGWNDVYMISDSLKGTVFTDHYTSPDLLNKRGVKTKRYKQKTGQQAILNEVHLFIKTGARLGDGNSSFSISDLERYDLYVKDEARNVITWIAGGTFLVLGAFVLFGLILLAAFAIGGSCPFIYTNTGDGYAFAGEIYSGAIYAPLERHDYLLLPEIIEEKGILKLKMTNELPEVQYTNLAELFVIDHYGHHEILVDKYGNYQVPANPEHPVKACNFNGDNILELIRNKDSICYSGINPGAEIPLTDGAITTFELPPDVSSGKLFLKARNSMWVDIVYKNFNSMLGSYGDSWLKRQNVSDVNKLTEWTLSQKIPLSVYIEKDGEWKFCDYFNPAGPMALKDDVIPVDLSGLNPGKIRIKLESGTNFWEIDYLALDFTINPPLEVKEVALKNAFNERDEEISELLKHDDLMYYVQNDNINSATLWFQGVEQTLPGRTIILHSKGYYNLKQEAKGIPRIAKLKSIRQPGQLLEYSRDLMQNYVDEFFVRR